MKRVRLHSGGISTGEVRLRNRGASERKTAPGKDIRDYTFDDLGVQRCALCGVAATIPGKRLVRCPQCLNDEEIVKKAHRKLAAMGYRGLDATIPAGTAGRRLQRTALAAQVRLAERKRMRGDKSSGKSSRKGGALNASPTSGARKPRARKKSKPTTCPTCHLLLPATGVCEHC